MKNLINIIVKIISHPLFITMTSIYLGTFLIDKMNRRKEKRDLKHKEALQLIKEVSEKINSQLTWLFWQIRTESHKIDEKLFESSRNAYAFRLQVKIRSEVIFGNSVLSEGYREIAKEIRMLINSVQEKKEPDNSYIIDLDNKWGIIKTHTKEDLKSPFDIYFEWAQSVWFYAEKYLLQSLQNAFELR
jgi:uncharacterized protein (UPF0332 family)